MSSHAARAKVGRRRMPRLHRGCAGAGGRDSTPSGLISSAPDKQRASDGDRGQVRRPTDDAGEVRRGAEAPGRGGRLADTGLVFHAACGASEVEAVLEIWESSEAFEAFGSKLLPLLEEVGIDAASHRSGRSTRWINRSSKRCFRAPTAIAAGAGGSQVGQRIAAAVGYRDQVVENRWRAPRKWTQTRPYRGRRPVVATAIRYGPFPPRPEYLPDCHRLHERGWFDVGLTDDRGRLWPQHLRA